MRIFGPSLAATCLRLTCAPSRRGGAHPRLANYPRRREAGEARFDEAKGTVLASRREPPAGASGARTQECAAFSEAILTLEAPSTDLPPLGPNAPVLICAAESWKKLSLVRHLVQRGARGATRRSLRQLLAR
jgi:hypothetical protein